MARLSQQRILELIKAPKHATDITLAIKQEKRLAFHTDCVQDVKQLTQNKAFNDWLAWAKSLLPADKWDKFEKLIMLPIDTNEIVESIYTELAKVFEAQNSQKKAHLIDKTLQADADDFLERTGLSSFMATRGWDAVRSGLNGFVIVDLPQVQTTFRPEPRVYYLHIEKVHDVEINDLRKVEYIMFRIEKDGLCVIDDEFYRIYRKDKGTAVYQFEAEFPHSWYNADGSLLSGLGYAPAQSLYPSSTGIANHIDKQGPITNVLGRLDWYLFKQVSYRYLGLYGDYPIMVTYKEACDYKNEQGNQCEGGRTAFEYAVGDGFNIRYDACPRCEGRKAVGPGSFWTVDPPRDATDVDLMKDPIKIIEVSNDKLVFGQEALDAMKESVFVSCVGQDNQGGNDQAKNEKQVMSGFESRQSVLEGIKLVLEETEEFIWDTVFIQRYGREYYSGSVVNYGNKFYLQTVEEVNERYVDAKTSGKPMYELAMLRDLANKTQNRHNPDEMLRTQILEQLEPWPDLAITQLQSMGLAESDIINYFVKLNFNSYVSRFERENMDIVEFGSKTSLRTKIDAITSKLQEYAKEQISSARANSPGPTKDPANPNNG